MLILFILLVLLGIVFGPLLAIWSLNTLFALDIPITLNTWLAALLLNSLINGSSVARAFRNNN